MALEGKSHPSLTVTQIKFFLNALKKGNANDIKHRRTLISVFINAIYLYDDKITLVFNSGDVPVTIDDKLLSEIEQDNKNAEKSVLEQSCSTTGKTAQLRCFFIHSVCISKIEKRII